ncbi:MAG: sulfatase-like hydrolase/transferase [Myxococcota bacterium]|nr:sulfatase-like hydrolase/transferase [Myxococcota bacterium]
MNTIRHAASTAFGVLLPAGLALGIVDGVLGGAVLPTLALWLIVTLAIALVTTIVLAATVALWGRGWIRRSLQRLRDDRALDRRVCAGLLAGIVATTIGAVALGQAADVLIGDYRNELGGWFEIGAFGSLLGMFALGVIAYVGLRKLLLAVGSASAFGPALVLLVWVLASVSLLGFVWIALHGFRGPEPVVAIMLIPVVATLLALVAYGPFDRLRERIPRRGTIVLASALVAIALPFVALGMTPSEATAHAVEAKSRIGGDMLRLLRSQLDDDEDGYTAFFRGADCDDANADVHPGAKEVPGNGVDDNCIGGDAALPPPPPPPTPVKAIEARHNLIVLFVDTLRFDRIGASGYKRDGKTLTPRLDAFAKESVVFRSAYAQAPATLRSAPSFLGSRYPTQLTVDRQFADYTVVSDDNVLLFEVLSAAGIATMGLTSHFYFCDPVRVPDDCKGFARARHSNILQGALEWDNSGAVDIAPSNHDIAGPRIVDKTIARFERMAASGERFAMLVHLFDPHSTYMKHDDWPITESGERGLAQKYDYEIAYEDRQIGRLLDALEQTKLASNTIVVLVSDHGEAFGVHTMDKERLFFHGHSLYRELLHVPLIFRVPGIAPREVSDVVELVDMAPTIVALLGTAPDRSWIGRDLSPLLRGEAASKKPAYAELVPAPWWNHEAKGMISEDGKKHIIFVDGRWELYDLELDPEERKNVIRSDPDAAKLKEQLLRWIDSTLATNGGTCAMCLR